MGVCVFVSSTRGDLDPDCRPAVLDGIRIARAVAVEMDSWDAPHGDPAAVCQDKIRRHSTHYLGLFAYRRGSAPKALNGKSITEAEYDWAVGCRREREIAVFLPKVGTPLDLLLRERARNQPAADGDAQEAFLDRVRARTCMPFADRDELLGKVSSKVTLWSGGGLMAMAAGGAAAAAPDGKPLTEEDVDGLGRRAHLHAFEQTWESLLAPGSPGLGCFLIHGPGGHGHDALLRRLWRLLEQKAGEPPRRVAVALDVPWKGKSPGALAAALARGLGAALSEPSPAALARELADVLQSTDVVLEIRRVQWLDGSLPALVQGLWQPLAAALAGRVRNRLVALLTLEQDLAVDWEPLVQQPAEEEELAGLDPARIIRLPRLGPFGVAEVARWLRRWFAEPDDLACRLVAETGGHPLTLYNRLRDESLWAL